MATGRTTREKLDFYRSLFTGLPQVYGTYDLQAGRAFQVKNPVTDHVLLQHLKGIVPMACTCWLGAASVRSPPISMPTAAMSFVAAARRSSGGRARHGESQAIVRGRVA